MIVRGAAYIAEARTAPRTPRIVLLVVRSFTRPTTNPVIRTNPAAIAMNNFTTFICTYSRENKEFSTAKKTFVTITRFKDNFADCENSGGKKKWLLRGPQFAKLAKNERQFSCHDELVYIAKLIQ